MSGLLAVPEYGGVAETIPMQPGQPKRIEYEYKRHGILCLIGNWHVVRGQMISPTIKPTRTESDFAWHIHNTVQAEQNGAPVLLQAEDVTEIHRVTRDMTLPAGSHELALEVHCTRGDTQWALRILELPDVEVVHGSIHNREEHDHGATACGSPFDVAIAADISSSMRPILSEAKDAMENFVEVCAADIRLALVAFASKAKVHATLGTDSKTIMKKITGLKTAGSTNMASAITLSHEQLSDVSRQRIILLYTDGAPNSKKATRLAVDAVRETPCVSLRRAVLHNTDAGRVAGNWRHECPIAPTPRRV